MNPHNFFAELKRRNVYKVAVAYAVVAWLLVQIATQVFPFFEIPNWAVRLPIQEACTSETNAMSRSASIYEFARSRQAKHRYHFRNQPDTRLVAFRLIELLNANVDRQYFEKICLSFA